MFTGFSLGLLGLALIAYLPSWIFAWIYRWVLSPLEIPPVFPKLAGRERRLMIMAFLTLFLVGLPLLFFTYLIGIFRHLRRQSHEHGVQEGDQLPLIPRFTMSDMLAMVFSMGCTPALFMAMNLSNRNETPWVFACVLITFPACFLSMLYRIQLHHVPAGAVRMALLALAPFVAISVVCGPFFLLITFAEPLAAIAATVFFGILVSGRMLSRIGVAQARALDETGDPAGV